jgi:hypothetical protein
MQTDPEEVMRAEDISDWSEPSSLKDMIDCIVRPGYVAEKKLTKGADIAFKG